MRKAAGAVVLALLLFPAAVGYGFPAEGQDCSKCHTLKKEEAEALVKELIPNAQVMSVGPSRVKSAWEVAVEAGGQKGLLYIDYSKKYLFLGSLVDIKGKRNLTQERYAELNKVTVDLAAIPLEDALLMGNKEAPQKIIVFSDPD